MIKYFIKVAFLFGIIIFILHLYGIDFFAVMMSNEVFFLSFKELFVCLFAIFVIMEFLFYGLRKVVHLLRNDVLLSNHAFEGDKESIEVIRVANGNKIVLSRSQFDEAAILIVNAMGSISAGLMNIARRHLVNLRKIIGEDAIIDVLMLKIYKGEKNFDKMEEISQKLMQNENIQLVGMKAALEAQMEKKEFKEALKTANQAFEVRQDLYWVLSSAFVLRAKNDDWLGALEVIDAGIEKNITPPQKASRLKAVALYELALQAKKENDKTKFVKFIQQALQENSCLIPAALDLADYYIKNDNQIRKAEKVLCSIWGKNPSYEIASIYLSLFPKDTKAEKIQRMERLALANTKRPSLNNLILAELYIDAKKYAKARTECRLLLLKNPDTQKIADMLEKLEEKQHKNKKDDSFLGSIKSHLNNLTQSDENDVYPKDFQWVCANCGHTEETWSAICPECGDVGRNYWHLYVDKKDIAEEL